MKRIELFNDHFQNFKVYGIPHAQLIIADPTGNQGNNPNPRLQRRRDELKPEK